MTADRRPSTANDLPAGWVWTTIGEVADTTSGGTPSRKAPEYYGGGIPWVKSGELEDGVVVSAEETITEDGLKNSSAKTFPTGTSLVALYGATVGKTGILGIDAATNQAVCAIFPRESAFTAKFITYWLQAQRQALIDQSTGGAQPNISQRIVRAFSLPLAPLAEQHRIVARIEPLFAQSRRGREALDAIPGLLARFRQAVLAAAFRGQLTQRNPDDEPASLLLERIRAQRLRRWEENLRAQGKGPSRRKYQEPAPPDTSELPELPRGWIWATTEQLAASEKYSMAIGPFGSNLLASEYQDEGVPLIFVRNIRSGVFVGPDTRYVTPEKAEELRAHRVDPGDILVTKMGDPPGDACLYPGTLPPAITTSDGIKWRLSSYLAERVYFVHAINSPLVREQIIRITQGVAQQKISLKRFKTVAIPLAPLPEQRRIVARIEALFAQADRLEAAVAAVRRRLSAVDQAILARAFRGELVPQDPADEPASVLLERIRKQREGKEE